MKYGIRFEIQLQFEAVWFFFIILLIHHLLIKLLAYLGLQLKRIANLKLSHTNLKLPKLYQFIFDGKHFFNFF